MPQYDVAYGLDCPCYGDTHVVADNVEQAIEIIKAKFAADTLIKGFEPHPDVGCENYRVVAIRDEDGEVVDDGFNLGMTTPDHDYEADGLLEEAKTALEAMLAQWRQEWYAAPGAFSGLPNGLKIHADSIAVMGIAAELIEKLAMHKKEPNEQSS